MALKETKQSKCDLFRPWDAAAAAESARKSNQETITIELETRSGRKNRAKTLEKQQQVQSKRESIEDPDSRSQMTSDSSSHHQHHSRLPISGHFNPYLATASSFSEAIRSLPFDHQATVPSIDPSNFSLFSSHDRNMFHGLLPSTPQFLDSQTAGNRTWKSQQRKQRPKRFQCPHCQVSFSNNGQLKGHVRIHTGKCLAFLLSKFTALRKLTFISDYFCRRKTLCL